MACACMRREYAPASVAVEVVFLVVPRGARAVLRQVASPCVCPRPRLASVRTRAAACQWGPRAVIK